MTTAHDTVPDLLNAIHALEPIIRKHADEAELNHRLSQPVVHAMASAGLFRAWMPRTLGGSEVSPLTLYRLVEEIARLDGSTGWLCLLFTPSAWSTLTFGRSSSSTPPTSCPGITGTGDPVVAGVVRTLLERVVSAGAAVIPSERAGFTVPFDPEGFKQVALELWTRPGWRSCSTRSPQTSSGPVRTR